MHTSTYFSTKSYHHNIKTSTKAALVYRIKHLCCWRILRKKKVVYSTKLAKHESTVFLFSLFNASKLQLFSTSVITRITIFLKMIQKGAV